VFVPSLRTDCIISGISLYTQSLLLVLAYCIPENGEEEEAETKAVVKGHRSQPSTASTSSEPSGGIRRRQNNSPPELRLIDLESQAEVGIMDGLSMSRYERLSSNDYHLEILPAQNAASAMAASKGALEVLAGFGTDMWNVAINPKSLFSSGTSVKSKNSGEDGGSGSKVASTTGSWKFGYNKPQTVHPNLVKPGAKIFIHSPYDCILATKRDLGDHLIWLLERRQYQQAWELLDEHPEIMYSPLDKTADITSSTPDKKQQGAAAEDVYDDTSSVRESVIHGPNSSAAKEKRRIGELWIQEYVEEGDWAGAAEICGKVITTSDRWDKWFWAFAGANQIETIANYLPAEVTHPPIPRTIYELVLGHFIQVDKLRFRDFLDRWPTELFDIKAITTALEDQLNYRDVREDSIEGGEKGRDWRIVMESLARLHEENGRDREALKCYIKLQDADSAFRLIRDGHLAEAVADDIPSFISLRVSKDAARTMSKDDLEDATSEAITLLVDEAHHGLLKPEVVVEQLKPEIHNLYLFFYLRGLWRGEGIKEHTTESWERLLMESRALVENFADLAVHLFAMHDQHLLMEFLRSSTSYGFEKVSCLSNTRLTRESTRPQTYVLI
jgi:vacuolar protein sorting-associated protein 41